MKKIYQILMLCAMVVALASCGGSNSSPEAAADYEDSVNIALEDRDFVKAYRFASKCYMTETVVSREAAYVLEEQGEAGLVRIAMIVNEHNSPEIYLEVLKMAISMANEELASKVYKMCGTCDEQCIDYAVTADMEKLVVSMLCKQAKSINKQSVKEYLEEKGSYKKVEAQLADILDNDVLSSIPELIGERPKPGLNGYLLGNELMGDPSGTYSEYREPSKFYHSAKQINTTCMRLLEKAIQDKNKRLADKVIMKFVQDIEITLGHRNVKVDGVIVDFNHSYIKYTNASKDAAKKRLREAVADGAFK